MANFASSNGRDNVNQYGGLGGPQTGTHHYKAMSYENLQKIRMYADWGSDIKGGVGDFIRSYLQDITPLGSTELVQVRGPGVNPSDLQKDVLVPLLMVQNGLMLSRSQNFTVQSFRHLLTDTLHPSSIPQATPKFILTYIDTEQSLAQPGNIHTLTGGNATTVHEIMLELVSKTTGVTVGDISMFYTSDPEDIVRVLSEKILQMSCTWDITMAVDHANYCANQPGFAESLLLNGQLPETSANSQLYSVLQLESLLCGTLNRNPINIAGMVTAGAKAIGKRTSECVAVIPQIILKAASTSRMLVDIELSGELIPRSLTYSVQHGDTLNGRCYIGSVTPEVGVDAVFPRQVNTEMVRRGRGDNVIPGVISGGQAIPIIALDDTPLSSSNKFSIQNALSRAGTKRLFFTVGVPPLSYERFANPGFFGGNMDITPGMVAMRSCRTSYVTNWDRGQSLEKVQLFSLHQHANNADNFAPRQTAIRFRNLNRITLEKFENRDSANLLKLGSYTEKLNSDQSRFEASARCMLYVCSQRTPQEIETIATALDDSTLNVIPRSVLGNTSPMNSLPADIVNVVSGMSNVVPKTKDIIGFMDFIKEGFTDSSIESSVDLGVIKNLGRGDPIPDDIMDRLVSKSGTSLVFTDFKAQLQFILTVDAQMDQPPGGAPVGWKDPRLYPAYNEIKAKIRTGHAFLRQYIKTLFEGNVTYCWPLAQQEPLIAVNDGLSPDDLLLSKFYYAIFLPTFTHKMIIKEELGAMTNDGSLYDPINVTNGIYMPSFEHSTAFAMFNPNGNGRETTMFAQVDVIDNGRIPLMGPLFQTRYHLSMETLGSGTYEMLLFMTHMMTTFDVTTTVEHFDKKYPSTLGYIGLRTVKFTGYDIAVMPKNSANLIFGNMYAAWPSTSSVSSTYNQVIESAIYPKTIDSIGTVLRNTFCTKISGYGTPFNPNDLNTIILLDCPSGFTPESVFTAGTTPDILPLSGRFDGDNLYVSQEVDEVSGVHSINPFMNPTVSDTVRKIQRWVEINDPPSEHAYVLFLSAINGGDFRLGLPVEIRDIATQTPTTIMESIVTGSKPASSLSEVLPLAFRDTYGIGAGSDIVTKKNTHEATTVETTLTPIVMGEGFTSSYLIGEDTGYVAKFGRLTGVEIDLTTRPNHY